MADELQRWIEGMPDRVEQQVTKQFAAAVDDELVEPIRRAARLGKTGRLKASVRKEAGADDLSWIVAAGGDLTTKSVGTRTYRRQINVGAGEDTQGVARGNASVSYDYALGEEFGNSHSPGNPFFWPTIRARMWRFRRRVEDIVNSALGGE